MKFSQLSSARLFYGFILLLGLFWIWVSAIPTNAATSGNVAAPQSGFLAPEFSLETLTGGTQTLADLRGKIVLVNFWTSWCPPCRQEMPTLQRVYQIYRAKGFVVLAVNSTIQDKLSDAQAFVSANNLSFPVLLDKNGEATRLYRIQSLPTSFFIGPDGLIREVVIGGPMAEALLTSRVEKLLGEVR